MNWTLKNYTKILRSRTISLIFKNIFKFITFYDQSSETSFCKNSSAFLLFGLFLQNDKFVSNIIFICSFIMIFNFRYQEIDKSADYLLNFSNDVR